MIKIKLKRGRGKHSFAAGGLGAAALMAAIGSAYSQAPQEPQQLAPESSERIIVTGSNIPTAADETSQPVSIVDRTAIDQSGSTTVNDILHRIPQVVGAGNFNGTQVNNPGTGESLIALRGLPATSTLVLVNGKRFALTAGAQIGAGEAVNINNIPLGAVDRIEVLKEGAGPIYGSDAVAGVVNIILRDHYNGAEFSAEYGNTTHKDAGRQIYDAIIGTSTDKFDLVLTGDYTRANGISAKDNPLFKSADARSQGGVDGRSSASNPGRINIPGLGSVNLNPGLDTGLSAADYHPYTTLATDKYNFNKVLDLTLPYERYGFSGDGTYKIIGDALKFRIQGFYNHSTTDSTSAPTPLFTDQEAPINEGGVIVPLAVPADNIHNPFVDPATGAKIAPNYVRYRFLELGPRIAQVDVNAFRFQGGFEGDLDEGKYHYETNATYSREDDTTISTGIVNKRELISQLNNADPSIASVNLFGDAAYNLSTPAQRAALRRIALTTDDSGRYETFQYVAIVGARPIHLPGGDLGIALGTEYRNENINLTPDSNKISSNTVGSTNSQPTQGNRDVYSGYVEVKIPITGDNFHLPGLWGSEIDFAYRREDFSDFGSADKPSVSGFIEPLPSHDLKLRGSYSQGFKAPTLGELHSGAAESFNTIFNPLAPDQIQALTLQSGNTKLQAENSRSYDFGFIYTPTFKYLKGLTIRGDAFRVTQRNNVTLLDPNVIIQQAVAGNGAFAKLLTFNPDGVTIASINDQYTNAGKTGVDGVDWGLSYVYPTEHFGTFTATWDSTWITRYREQLPDPITGAGDGKVIRLEGSTGGGLGNAIPRLRGLGTVSYDLGGFNATTNITYIGELSEDPQGNQGTTRPGGAPIPDYRLVEAWVSTDVQFSYTFGKPGPAPAPLPAPKEGKDGKGGGGKEVASAPMAVPHGHFYDGLTLSVGANNIFDTSAPFEENGFASGLQTDVNLYDITGRFIYGRVTKKF